MPYSAEVVLLVLELEDMGDLGVAFDPGYEAAVDVRGNQPCRCSQADAYGYLEG